MTKVGASYATGKQQIASAVKTGGAVYDKVETEALRMLLAPEVAQWVKEQRQGSVAWAYETLSKMTVQEIGGEVAKELK